MQTILIVDDEESIRFILEDCLTREKYKVLLAKNGKDALSIFNQCHVDLIITDMQMPVMNGLAFIENVRSTHSKPQPAVIVMTGFTTAEPENLEALAVNTVIAKPFKLEPLINSVLEALSRKPT